jgi:hypothetical protein
MEGFDMSTFEIFFNNGKDDAEGFKFEMGADSIDQLVKKLERYMIVDYNAFPFSEKGNEYCLIGNYRDLDVLFGLNDDQIEYVDEYIDTGYVCAREICENGKTNTQ